jgi:hypothetical protein
MGKNIPAIRQFISPLEHRFLSSEIRAGETLPALRTSTSSTSLVLYEKRLPGRYFISRPIIELAINRETESGYDLPGEGECTGYDPQGRLLHPEKKGLWIDAFI